MKGCRKFPVEDTIDNGDHYDKNINRILMS